jgi:hypothetical protein
MLSPPAVRAGKDVSRTPLDSAGARVAIKETVLMLTESHPISRRFSARFVLGLVTLACLLAPHALAAVRDDAGFFSEEAVRQANQTIAQMKQNYGKDVVIETYPSIPDSVRQRTGSASVDQLFDRWLRQRIADEKVNGIIVLITRDPARVQVGVDGDTGKQAFIKSDYEQMRTLLVSDFREKQFDRGLQQALAYVQQTLERSIGNRGAAGATGSPRARDPGGVMTTPGRSSDAGSSGAGTQQPAPDASARSSESQGSQPPAPVNVPVGQSGSRGMGLGSMMCLIIGAVIVIGLIARLISRRQAGVGPTAGGYGAPGYGAGYGAPGYPPATGGGMGRGFLGGLLGGLLGGAAYDRWTRGSSDASSIYNDPGRHGLNAPMPAGSDPSNDPSQDFSGSAGGDFGSSDAGSAGGDFGGGGDVGGDVGGGGGDTGGGGDVGGGGDAGGSAGGDF